MSDNVLSSIAYKAAKACFKGRFSASVSQKGGNMSVSHRCKARSHQVCLQSSKPSVSHPVRFPWLFKLSNHLGKVFHPQDGFKAFSSSSCASFRVLSVSARYPLEWAPAHTCIQPRLYHATTHGFHSVFKLQCRFIFADQRAVHRARKFNSASHTMV